MDILKLTHRKEVDLEVLWVMSKEGWQKSRLTEYAAQQQALSKFTLGAILVSEPALAVVRRELRRVSPEAKIEIEQILQVLTQDVLKREVLEGERADAARKLVSRAAKRQLRERNGAGNVDQESSA